VRITARVLVKPGQEIGLGSSASQVAGGGELAQAPVSGNVTSRPTTFWSARPRGKRLLDPSR